MYFVYIIYSQGFDKYYIGQSNNHILRLDQHNAGAVKSTKGYRPWKIAWFCQKPTRSEAMILEKKLKNLNRERLLQFIKKFSS
jgi:putative endonuclease